MVFLGMLSPPIRLRAFDNEVQQNKNNDDRCWFPVHTTARAKAQKDMLNTLKRRQKKIQFDLPSNVKQYILIETMFTFLLASGSAT